MSYEYEPGPPYAAPGAPPRRWLAPAILSMLFCWPLAIPAIVYASQVKRRYEFGDVAGAYRSARRARLFTLLAFVVGVAGYVFLIVHGSYTSVTVRTG